jgi:hypothetical protein
MSLPTSEETTPAEPVRARVRRLHDQRIVLQFVELQDPDSLARSFG